MAPQRKPKPKRNCVICGTEFELKSNGPSHAKRKYCSPKCVHVAQRQYTDRSWTLSCSVCGDTTKYITRENYRRAIRENRTMCIPCRGKANKGLKRTEDQRTLISEKTKVAMNSDVVKKKVIDGMNNPEVKRKLREHRIKQIQLSGQLISYNKDACKFFDELNNELDLSGIHALNGGEKQVAGYFVDYYEPNLNLVIEWDERHHKKQINKDIHRAKEIIKEIGCKFLRIDEETLELTEVTL